MNVVESRPPKPKLLPKPGSVKVVRALYAYDARTTEELTFDEGDILYVFEQGDDGWWKAKHNGKFGLIPFNYVSENAEVKEPLHDASRRGNLAFLTECLNQGVSGTSLDAMGNTPLYWASHSGHLDCVQALLALANAPINAQNAFGDTPLHGAASRNHLSIVELLLDNKANVTIKNSMEEAPEDLAMDPAIKNLLQLRRANRQSLPMSFQAEEYDDDSE